MFCNLKKKIIILKQKIFNENKLIDAVYNNEINKVKSIIKNGTNVNKISYYHPYDEFFKQTPLTVACRKKYYYIVKLLINNGANINFIDEKKRTPFFWACTYYPFQKENKWRFWILDELKKNANDLTLLDCHRPPLYEAIKTGDTQLVCYLLRLGNKKININNKIKKGFYKGYSLLDLAKKKSIKRYLEWYSYQDTSAVILKFD